MSWRVMSSEWWVIGFRSSVIYQPSSRSTLTGLTASALTAGIALATTTTSRSVLAQLTIHRASSCQTAVCPTTNRSGPETSTANPPNTLIG